MSDNNSSPQPTMGELIDKHQEIDAYIAAQAAAFAKTMAPWQQALGVLNAEIKSRLLGGGMQNSKSANGWTAYISRTLSVKVVDREKYLDFVVNDNWQYLDARVLKGPVEDWIEKNQTERIKQGLAPLSVEELGLEVTPIVKCNVRKS